MKSNNLTLGEVLASPCQYVIPVFQRYYRWDQPQWDKLWNDLVDLQEPDRTGRHFMGFLVMVPETFMPGRINRSHLIDGQQRLTTLSLILCALRDAARLAGFDDLAMKIEFSTLVHQFETGEDRFRVFPKLRDREQYVACINGETPADGRLGAAVRYFAGRLTTIPEAGTEAGLRAFYDLLSQRLEFVYAQLEGENPFNIFKSLNSTGVPLGPADLIRNFVFMNLPVEHQDAFDQAHWKPMERRFEDQQGILDAEGLSSFLRDHLMRHGEYIRPAETFDAFQRKHSATAFDPVQVTIEAKKASGWYEILLGNRPDSDPEVEAVLAQFRQLESSTTDALLLNLYERRDRGALSPKELIECLRLLSGFILRRLVCGENSRGYARLFVQAAGAIGESPVDDLRRFLESRGFPDTPRFVRAFVTFDLYHSRYRKAVLVALERAQGHKEPVVLSKAQVEHIMPQTLTDAWRETLGDESARIHSTWLHTPGNLTLTGYNPELLNKPFAIKREGYKNSNIVLTRRVADSESWGEAEIEQRARWMAEDASRIWPGPAVPVERASDEAARIGPSRFDLRLRFWTGFRDHLKESGSELDPAEPGPRYRHLCGRLGVGKPLYAYLNLRNRRLAVSACFHGKRAEQQFHAIRQHQEAIEAEIGSRLIWTARPGGDSLIVLRNPVDPTDETIWPSYYDWMRRSLETFRRVLAPHITRTPKADRLANHGEGVSDAEQFRLDYWFAFRDLLTNSSSPVKPRKPQPDPWYKFAAGRSHTQLATILGWREASIAVELTFWYDQAQAYYTILSRDREAIEAEIGEPLEWQDQGDRRHSKIRIKREGVDLANRQEWPDQHQWLREKLECLHRVFVPRIKAISPEDLETAETDDMVNDASEGANMDEGATDAG
ncbi:DUF4268 domain-containing protein [Tautonia marina]|uniref:DUF4268 domain-containing protein n=1 Tax=Tautonia marina TaxID=2653855 RepID=UPI001260D2A6|nr:DUF4268 domain-containing protein [Tautonia marina]